MCRCLFALAPNPSSSAQDVLVFTHWTMARLVGELGIAINTDVKPSYAKYLLVALKPSSHNLDFSITAHRGDALCVVDEDHACQETMLGGRRIDSTCVDVKVIEQRLSTCQRLHHVDCSPIQTHDLQEFRLPEPSSREVVGYPGPSCEHLALSYVWGGVIQPSFHMRSVLGKLPQTIEDFLAFAEILRKQYVWADSLCIDQDDKVDKRNQIQKMWSIYQGAYLTVIALSGEPADAGLPRCSSQTNVSSNDLPCQRKPSGWTHAYPFATNLVVSVGPTGLDTPRSFTVPKMPLHE